MIVFIAIDETQMYEQKRYENFDVIHRESVDWQLSGSFSLQLNRPVHIVVGKETVYKTDD